MLAYDDGRRKAFPETAARLKALFKVQDVASARSAIAELFRAGKDINNYRDGLLSVPLRSAHWLCMAAIEVDAGRLPDYDYGISGILDTADYMGVPCPTV